jgi:hypothetical protein
MDCLDVRERLVEHALGTLGGDESLFVKRHLDWCAGCRKEADELAEGATLVALAATDGTPPAALEDKVVREIRAVAGTHAPSRPGGFMAAATALGVIVALGAALLFSWRASLVADLTDAEERAADAELRVKELTDRLDRGISEFISNRPPPGPRDVVRRAVMVPEQGRNGGAGVLVLTSPDRRDWSLVLVGGLPRKGLPYSVILRDGDGSVLRAGKIRWVSVDGSGELFREFDRDLRPFVSVLITDAAGEVVLRGKLPPWGSPTASAVPTISG